MNFKILYFLPLCLHANSALGAETAPTNAATESVTIETILVTARLRTEDAQTVPVSMSVINADELEITNTFNLSQLSQLVPSLNYSSPNPRNTALTIRGLGSSVVAVAQANDGLEPGVGFYVDQVYHARPATAAFDFMDLERIEVLRGPQGTLFGKNTTAGAINISTRPPSFNPEFIAEFTGGNYAFRQSRFSATGPLRGEALAGRISLAKTDREGMLTNTLTGKKHNDLDNTSIQIQLLYQPHDSFSLRLTGDFNSIDSNCCTQVYYQTGKTLRDPARQFPTLAAGQHYQPASTNAFTRRTDIDAFLKVLSREGGVAAIADWRLGSDLSLKSISAWRYWQWDAANDRDYTALSIQTIQGIPSRQDQYSQEFQLSSLATGRLAYTVGLYFFTQTIRGKPVTEYGPLASYWLLGPPPQTPANLLDGYRSDGNTRFRSDNYAVFGEATWKLQNDFSVTGGLRYTYENKNGRFQSEVSGGLATLDPRLVSQKLSILRPQSYTVSDSDGSFSGRLSLNWQATDALMPYLTLASGYKSGGINMSGLPLNASNQPALTTALIKPEHNNAIELGMKSRWLDNRLLLNIAVFHTTVSDFQANVVDTDPGALRGYLANIDKVVVRGAEFDARMQLNENLALYVSSSWIDGKYTSYSEGPCPLERIGNTIANCDLSGTPLTAQPRWVFSGGVEYERALQIAGISGSAYLRSDLTARDSSNGQSSNSIYTEIADYKILNGSLGFRADGNWDVVFWLRNALDEEYMSNLTVQAGNSGLVIGLPGDPTTFGITLRASYN